MCSAPAFHAQAADRSTCRVDTLKGARLHTKWTSLSPSKWNLYPDDKNCGRQILYFSEALSFSSSRNTFISYLHYNILHSECMQKNIVRTTDIKAAGACPNNRFDKKHLSVRFLKPESSSGLISSLVDSCSCKS